jgi:hypothetical protein
MKKKEQEDPISLSIPDDAITFIVSHYIRRKASDGSPIVVGISSDTVEGVLGLFFDWAASKDYIKDGKLVIETEQE